MSLNPAVLRKLVASVKSGVCAFGVACGRQVSDRGGLDEHHPDPEFMGGDPGQILMLLCPNHHRRQHALIRAYVEAGGRPKLTSSFATIEWATAQHAFDSWVARGRPALPGWSVPAAT